MCHLRPNSIAIGPSLYPPTTPAALRRLLHSIHSSPVDRLKQDCFFYYLLRDYDVVAPTANGHPSEMEVDEGEAKPSSRAEGFARQRCLPKAWRVFMNGYWALDHALFDVSAMIDSRQS